jgi:vitamin B12 transporter
MQNQRLYSAKRVTASLFGLALFSGTGLAQLAQAQTELNPVVVTPSRYAKTANSSLADVSVITRKDIEREQPRDVVQALRGLPGVEIDRSGGYGKISSVFLRGTNGNQVLVLVNGVRMGSATDGRAAWEFIPINQVERIEVVRGPRSSLYGADAVGGVIQIFTRQGPRKGKHGEVSLTGGSRGTGAGNAAFGWGNGRTHGAIDIGLFHTDGIDAVRKPSGIGRGVYAVEPDHDAYQNENLSVALAHRFRKRDELAVNFLRSQGYSQYDPLGSSTQPDLDHFIQSVLGVKYRLAFNDHHSLRLHAGRTRVKRTSRREDRQGAHSRFDTTRPSVSLIHQYRFVRDTWLKGVTWLLGADYYNDRLSSATDYREDERYNYGVFTEFANRNFGVDWQVSGRFDHNQAYGDHFTGQIGLGYDITRAYRVEASYGTAFHAPTFNDLYYPSFPGSPPASNPDLDPERSRSAEIDFLGNYGWGGWRVDFYQTKIQNLITLDSNFTPQNASHARIRGVELQTHAHLNDTRIKASAGYIQPLNREENHDLNRRPRWSGSVSVDQDIGPFSVGAELDAYGPRYDSIVEKLGGFTLIGLRGAYHITQRLTLRASVDNLLDKRYATQGAQIFPDTFTITMPPSPSLHTTYRSLGRTAYATITWQFDQE